MKTIALCGVNAEVTEALERHGTYRLISFSDSMEYRGEVQLIYFLNTGYTCDLAVVGYPGAAGLSACDYLRGHSGTLPILWLCDRGEFLKEAARLGAKFYLTGPPKGVTEQKIISQIEQAAQSGSLAPQCKER